MHDTPVHRSALDGVLPPPSDSATRRAAGVHVMPHHTLGCLVLRGRAGDTAFITAVRGVLGAELPTRPSTYVDIGGGESLLWMSPDEWWLLLPRTGRDTRLSSLTAALNDVFAQVVDVSGTLACLTLSGREHLTVLRHLTPYDVERLAHGACVSTAIPRATLTVLRPDADRVRLVFRRSFADWVWRLIERSAQPYGLAISADADTIPTSGAFRVHAA